MYREDDPRFRNLERKIGAFIVLAVAGIAIALVLFGIQKDLFTKKYNLKFTVDRGTGFTRGMPVKLSGFRIGRITSIALNEQAMVDILVEIDNKYRSWIRSDSVVKLVKEGLVGDSIVEISVGSRNKPELKNNESITYVKTRGLDELADDIAEKVKPVLSEVRDIISYINNPDGDLKKSFRNLELLTRNLEGTRQNADQLIVTATGNVERIGTRTSKLLDTATHTVEHIDLTPTLNRVNDSITRIDQRLPALLDRTENALAHVNAIAGQAHELTSSTFPRIPGVLSQVEDVMLSTDRLLNSINNSWLFRDTSSPHQTAPDFVHGDSHE